MATTEGKWINRDGKRIWLVTILPKEKRGD
jgi:hypothetical protein